MAQNSINFANFTYVDDDGISWNKRGEDGGPAAAVDGHTAPGANQAWRDRGRRQRARAVVYVDDTDVTGGRSPTFRKYRAIMYTAAAYAAVALGDSISVPVPGLATSVSYKARDKQGERKIRLGVSRPGLID